jgi:rubrerythrin
MNMSNMSAFTDALANILKYADNNVQYPDLSKIKGDDGVMAEWFYNSFNNPTGHSELDAIMIYTGQEAKFEEISELMLGIGLIEMKHYDKLQDLIKTLGGNIERRYNNSSVSLGIDVKDALNIALKAERKTIEEYRKIQEKLTENTKTVKIVQELLTKLIADEILHEKLLTEKIIELDVK